MTFRLLKWMRRRLQTRTGGVSQATAPAVRKNGTATAYRRSGSLFLMTQLFLWACLTGTAAAGRTLWQAAVLLIPAGIGVWWVSRWVWAGQGSANLSREKNRQQQKPKRRSGLLSRFGSAGFNAESGTASPAAGTRSAHRMWEVLLLIPCVLVDAVAVLHALLGILSRLMPSYPAGILRIFIPSLLLLGVLLGKRNGTAYGVSLWRWLVPVLAVWVLLHVLRDQGLDDLYPLWSWKETASAWATGLGALWPAGLLFLLPECSGDPCSEGGKPPRTVHYVLVPLLLGSLCALGLSACGSWRFSSETAGYRLLFAGRSSGSMMTSGLWSLFWLLALMTCFSTALMCGQKLLEGLFPRCRSWLHALFAALTASILLWLWQTELPPWFLHLLPWRLALWAAAAGWAAIRRIRQKRNQRREWAS